MDYEEFDIGNFDDEICVKICKELKENPLTAQTLTYRIYHDEYKISLISTKLQKLKTLDIVGNVKTGENVCWWGLNKKHRGSH